MGLKKIIVCQLMIMAIDLAKSGPVDDLQECRQCIRNHPLIAKQWHNNKLKGLDKLDEAEKTGRYLEYCGDLYEVYIGGCKNTHGLCSQDVWLYI